MENQNTNKTTAKSGRTQNTCALLCIVLLSLATFVLSLPWGEGSGTVELAGAHPKDAKGQSCVCVSVCVCLCVCLCVCVWSSPPFLPSPPWPPLCFHLDMHETGPSGDGSRGYGSRIMSRIARRACVTLNCGDHRSLAWHPRQLPPSKKWGWKISERNVISGMVLG